jgi:hypothetical protein
MSGTAAAASYDLWPIGENHRRNQAQHVGLPWNWLSNYSGRRINLLRYDRCIF